MKKKIRKFLFLTGLLTTVLYVLNKCISISSSLKNLLKTDRGQTYDWKYGSIFYTKSGKGAPLLLIHDLNPAASSMEWEKVYKSLSKNHTVYMIDLLGCGRSDKPRLTYTNYLFVQLVTDFIKDVIKEKATVAATGSSGSFTVMAAHMNPEQFEKILLINPENLCDLMKSPNHKKNLLKTLMELPIFGTFFYNLCYSAIGVSRLFADRYYFKRSLASSKTLDCYYESAHLKDSRGKYLLSSILSDYTKINITHALVCMEVPIVLFCSKENEASRYIRETYLEYQPSIECYDLSKSSYLPQMETPEKFLSAMEGALR